MKDNLTTTVIKERRPRREIRYWTAQEPDRNGDDGPIVDYHESIAILRARNNPNCIFKAYR